MVDAFGNPIVVGKDYGYFATEKTVIVGKVVGLNLVKVVFQIDPERYIVSGKMIDDPYGTKKYQSTVRHDRVLSLMSYKLFPAEVNNEQTRT